MASVPKVVRFDHTILAARDRHESATFLAEMLGLAEPVEAGPFVEVKLGDGASIDFAESTEDFPGVHLALLVDDDTFDRVIGRIREQGIPHWADPHQHHPGEINTHNGGRGVYFQDPGGHFLEALTVRYDGTAWHEV